MTNASIKKYFKQYLKETYDKELFIDQKILKKTKNLYVNYQNTFFIQCFISRGEFSFNCNNSRKLINNLGQYISIIWDRRNEVDPFYNAYSLTLLSNYGVEKKIDSEDDLRLFFNDYIVKRLNSVLIPRAKRIITVADCYELNKSWKIEHDIFDVLYHLLFIKLVNPSIAGNFEDYIAEELLFQLGEQNWNDKGYYVNDEELMAKFKRIMKIDQGQELEEGRLLESDLVVTTKNEEWPSFDPDFKELIDPEMKKIIYG